MTWACSRHMRGEWCIHNLSFNIWRKGAFTEKDLDEKNSFKWILEKYYFTMGSGFIWLRTGTGAGWWEYANEPSLFWKPGSCWLTERPSVSWRATCQLGGVRHSFVFKHVRTHAKEQYMNRVFGFRGNGKTHSLIGLPADKFDVVLTVHRR